MILFEVPTPGGQRLFGLKPNIGRFPLLGYMCTLLRMPRPGLPCTRFCSNVDAALRLCLAFCVCSISPYLYKFTSVMSIYKK